MGLCKHFCLMRRGMRLQSTKWESETGVGDRGPSIEHRATSETNVIYSFGSDVIKDCLQKLLPLRGAGCRHSPGIREKPKFSSAVVQSLSNLCENYCSDVLGAGRYTPGAGAKPKFTQLWQRQH